MTPGNKHIDFISGVHQVDKDFTKDTIAPLEAA